MAPGPFEASRSGPLEFVLLLFGVITASTLFVVGDSLVRRVRNKVSRTGSTPEDHGV